MTYKYKGSQTIQAEQERQEQLRAELEEARNAYKEAVKIRRANERIEAEILRTQQRTAELAKPVPTMPEPVYGGPLGLRRAAKEIQDHDRRKRQEQAA